MDVIAELLEQSDGAGVAGVGIDAGMVIAALDDFLLEADQDLGADPPALKVREHPKIGDEIVSILAGTPAGGDAFPFGEQYLGPVLAAEGGVGILRIVAERLGVFAPVCHCEFPGRNPDDGQSGGVGGLHHLCRSETTGDLRLARLQREVFGPIAYIIRARVTLLRDLGQAMSPFNAFLFIQGLETLPLRMREHCRNAKAVAEYLRDHAEVTSVIYPGLFEGEDRRRADHYLQGGQGGLVGFELKGGLEAGRKFIDSLRLFYHVANIGDARSLAIHPATTTHSQLSPEEQKLTGVSDGYVRLSVGIEHIDDILADLDQALRAAGKGAAAA